MQKNITKITVLTKIIFLSVFVVCVCLSSACIKKPAETSDQNSAGGGFTQSTGGSLSGTSVISLYDDESNFVEEISFTQPDKNTVSVEHFAKTGYKFEGIYEYSTGAQFFTNKGSQVPGVYLDRNFNALIKYSPIKYQLVFEATDGKLENSDDYIKNISYDETLGLMPSVVYETSYKKSSEKRW